MQAKIILNPYSNRWKAGKRWAEAEIALKEAGIGFSLAVSEYRGHDAELAFMAAAEGYWPLIAAGGDGTIGQIINGLAGFNGESFMGTVGIIPLGTANDLAVNLGLPLQINEAVRVIAAGKTRKLDVCRLGNRYFINNSAVGLEPYITSIEKKIRFIKGIPRYLAAAVKGIGQNPCWQGEIEWDEGSFIGRLNMVSIGNAPRTGGVFYLTPHADPSDGKLTVLLVEGKSRRELFSLLPQAMKPDGKFLRADGITEFHTSSLRISLQSPSPAHCDGELLEEELQDFTYTVLPDRLKVFV